VEFEFTSEIHHWRGPAPHHFVTVPPERSADIQALAAAVTYGWGMIPVGVRIGGTDWTTSLFAKDGGYVLPVKSAVRKAESLDLGDTVTVRLTVHGR